MTTFLILIIYLSFISLGLPDSLLGAGWPMMRLSFSAPLPFAGLLSMCIAGGTILSSFASGFVSKRLGTGRITFLSCLTTALSLLGFACAPSLIWLIVLAIPLGLGAGSVDAALNHHVATHYKAHHMSWLHCFWGVGATLGPVIMSWFISHDASWRAGYLTVSLIQLSLALLLFLTLPLWKHQEQVSQHNKQQQEAFETEGVTEANTTSQKVSPLKITGVKLSLVAFLFYCGTEAAMGLWGSSFLVELHGLTGATAAQWVSLYYGGITLGRFFSGFLTMKFSNRHLIRSGQLLVLIGIAFVLLPILPVPFIQESKSVTLVGFLLVGLGCAPIFPCMLHETPARFGKASSQSIIGFQMALAYTGSTFIPPLVGLFANQTTIGILPVFLVLSATAMLLCTEWINRIVDQRVHKENLQST